MVNVAFAVSVWAVALAAIAADVYIFGWLL